MGQSKFHNKLENIYIWSVSGIFQILWDTTKKIVTRKSIAFNTDLRILKFEN